MHHLCVALVLHIINNYCHRPNRVTYAILLEGLFKNNLFDDAMKLFLEIQDMHLENDITIYTILLNGLCSYKKFTSALELFYRLPEMGLQPNL